MSVVFVINDKWALDKGNIDDRKALKEASKGPKVVEKDAL